MATGHIAKESVVIVKIKDLDLTASRSGLIWIGNNDITRTNANS